MVIQYDYRVRGQSYTNDRVTFGQTFLSDMLGSVFQSGTLEKYPQGKMISIYYNPDSPQDAVIENALPVSAYVVMVIAVMIIGFTLGPWVCAGD